MKEKNLVVFFIIVGVLVAAVACQAKLPEGCPPDCMGADLAGANLAGADLSEVNLAGANLTGTNLQEANLRGANLREANLTKSILSKADLTGADLTDANLTDALLYSTKIGHGTQISDAVRIRVALSQFQRESEFHKTITEWKTKQQVDNMVYNLRIFLTYNFPGMVSDRSEWVVGCCGTVLVILVIMSVADAIGSGSRAGRKRRVGSSFSSIRGRELTGEHYFMQTHAEDRCLYCGKSESAAAPT